MDVTFSGASSSQLEPYSQTLIDVLATSLGISSDLITISISDTATGATVSYTIVGDYTGTVTTNSFKDEYYNNILIADSTLYGLSQGTGGATSKFVYFVS